MAESDSDFLRLLGPQTGPKPKRPTEDPGLTGADLVNAKDVAEADGLRKSALTKLAQAGRLEREDEVSNSPNNVRARRLEYDASVDGGHLQQLGNLLYTGSTADSLRARAALRARLATLKTP